MKEGAILDLGCIDERHPERIAQSLHARLRALNPKIVGADGDARAVEQVKRLGFEVLRGDAEKDSFGGPFDALFAGELIEHLNNPGLFLENARRHLRPGGKLLLTTPNPFYANQFAKILKHGRPQAHEAHRSWFSPETLETLLAAHRFEIVDFIWFAADRGPVRNFLSKLRPYWSSGFGVCAQPLA